MDPNRTKGCVTFILVLAVILAIAAAAVAYYFYSIGDLNLPGTTQAKQNCGCFYTSVDGSCSSTNSALTFNIGNVDANGKCIASCPAPANDTSLSGLSCEYMGKPTNGTCSQQCSDGFEQKTVAGASDTENYCLCCKTQELKACNQINLKENLSCTNLTVTTKDDKIIIPPFNPNVPLKLTATFDANNNYQGFVFKVNGMQVPDTDMIPGDCTSNCIKDDGGVKPYVIINPQDYLSASAISLQISVEGVLNTALKNVDTTPCTRSYLLIKNQTPSCGSVSLVTKESSGKFSVDGAAVKVSSLPTGISNLKTKFTFSPVQSGITSLTTKDSSSYLSGSDITMNTTALTSASTFVENKAFPIVDPLSTVQVDVLYNLDGAVTTLSCGSFEVDKAANQNDNGSGNGGNNNGGGVVDNGNTPPTGAVSDFSVTKTGPACIERVSPKDVASFTIQTTNRTTSPDLLDSITDKLPLGFEYQAGSTKINNVVKNDSDVVTVTTVGNSQEITWKQTDGFSLEGGQVMTITFNAVAGSQAITGSNLNEVVISPINTPKTPENIRTSFTFEVAQTCGTPKTGLFDDTGAKVIAGIAVLIIGFLFSITATGEKLSMKIASSNMVTGLINNLNEVKAELFVPKYSFEKKVLNENKRKKNRKNKTQ